VNGQITSSKPNRPTPAILAFACVALGVWLAGRGPVMPLWPLALVTVACACGALVASGRSRPILLGLGAIALGATAFHARVLHLPPDALGPALRQSGETLLRAEGVIVTQPERRKRSGRFAPYTFQSDATIFRLRVDRVIGVDGASAPASGTLSVRVDGGAPRLRAGQRVQVTGRALPTLGATNPSPSSMLRWASQTKWAGAIVTSDARNVVVLQSSRYSLTALRARLQSRAGAWIDNADISPESRAVLSGALLGAEEPELADVRRTLERVGAAHVLAISGLHLAALSWLLLLALRPFPWADRWAPLLVALVIVLYAWLVPARPAVVRATVMVIAFLAAEASGRRYNRIAVLALAAIAVLLWRPLELTRPGFQLTFAVVAALVALAEPLRTRLFGVPTIDPDMDRARDRCMAVAQRTASAALAAWLVATPLLAYHFGIFNPLAPIGALLLAPLFAATLALGQAAVLLGVLAPQASFFLAPLAVWLAHLTVAFAQWMSDLPGAYLRLPIFSPLLPIGFLALVMWWVLARSYIRPRILATAIFLTALIASLVHSASSNGVGAGVALRIDTFDVGNGSCHLLRTPGGAFLWDAGGSDLDAGMREIPQAIRQVGAWRVPAAVLTHANIDHYAMLPDLIEPLGIERVYVNPFMADELQSATDGPLRALREGLEGVEIIAGRAGDTRAFGRHTLEFLWPDLPAPPEGVNNTSLVARITVRTTTPRRLLMTGDVEDEAIIAMRMRPAEIRADVMEVPHHGSARIEAIDWVFAVDPFVVLQSTGPSRQDDERWDAAREGRRWLTTSKLGSVAVEVHADGRITTFATSERAGPRSQP
jgi:ComEC/Rec2-related protein